MRLNGSKNGESVPADLHAEPLGTILQITKIGPSSLGTCAKSAKVPTRHLLRPSLVGLNGVGILPENSPSHVQFTGASVLGNGLSEPVSLHVDWGKPA